MIDFSDILNANKSKPNSMVDKKKSDNSVDFSAISHAVSSQQLSKTKSSIAGESLKKIYTTAIILAERILNKPREIDRQIAADIYEVVDEFIKRAWLGGQELFDFIFDKDLAINETNYCDYNLVNTCVLVLEIGAGFEYTQEKLRQLGVAAFLHDIGMCDFKGLAGSKRKLTIEELQRVHKHTELPQELKSLIELNFGSDVLTIINQEHERYDGTGYPRGLKGDNIIEAAQIIGLADTYEALLHYRPYRDRNSCLEAVKILLKTKEAFNLNLLKEFLNRIGIYLKGTTVELSTREIAKVIKQNFKLPSCPIVRIIIDQQGREEINPREIDLSQGTKVYITRSL